MHAHSYKQSTPDEQKIVLRKALLRMAEHLALTRRELAAVIGLSEASISRLYDNKRFIEPHSKEGELATLLLRLYRSLDTLFGGNEQQCRLWLRSNNHHLNSTPIELIVTIQGLLTTISYLDAMRGRN